MKNNTVYTPKESPAILDGNTRKMIISCLRGNGVEVVEGNYHICELFDAQEVWLTSSIRGLKRVKSINYQEKIIKFNSSEMFGKIVEAFSIFCKQNGENCDN